MDKEDRDITKRQWVRMLRGMLREYRSKHPQDKRSDRELLDSLMEHFAKSGIVGKTKDGKYVIGKILYDA